MMAPPILHEELDVRLRIAEQRAVEPVQIVDREIVHPDLERLIDELEQLHPPFLRRQTIIDAVEVLALELKALQRAALDMRPERRLGLGQRVRRAVLEREAGEGL